MVKALVSHIQRYSTKDGPGIRSTVFMTGCTLNCLWCANPELIENRLQVLHFRARCHKCGECLKVDPSIVMESDGAAAERSDKKEELVAVCPFDAFEYNAKQMSSDEVLEVLLKDREYYQMSEGGVTFSGGECLIHKGFLIEVMKKLKEEGIHCCIDTAGNVPLQTIKDITAYTDLFLYDIKSCDNAIHERCTGSSNRQIFDNFHFLCSIKVPLWIRLPIVHGLNDDEEDFRKRLQLIKDKDNITRVDVLCYHEYGVGKYKALGKEYLVNDGAIGNEQAERIMTIAKEEGVKINLIRE